MKKKDLAWTIIAIIIAAFSIWAVSAQVKDFSLSDLRAFVVSANPLWLGVAVLCMLLYIILEGMALLCILKAFGYKRSFRQGIVYSSADIYFSAITPSATGGQPASAYFMLADGVPAAVSAVTLLLNLVLYTIAILTLGLIAVLLRPEMFFHFEVWFKALICIGYVILSGLSVFFVLLIRKEHWIRKICETVIRFLHRIHLLRKVDKWESKLDKLVQDYRQCSDMIEGQMHMVVKAFIFNLLQRGLQICVPAMVYLSAGGSLTGAVDVWVTQSFVTIGSNCIPIPGAMGITDFMLIDGLANLMGHEEAITMELVSRGISFYSCVLISICIVGIGYIACRKRYKKNSRNQ